MTRQRRKPSACQLVGMSEGETAKTGGDQGILAETALADSEHDAVACGKHAGVDGSPPVPYGERCLANGPAGGPAVILAVVNHWFCDKEEEFHTLPLDVQRASLEICKACRNVPAARVRVNSDAPPHFLAAGGSAARVPALRAREMVWNLPLTLLSPEVELLEGLQCLMFADEFNEPVAGFLWPPSLRKLVFGWLFNQPITGMRWHSLRELTLGDSFDQPIIEVDWPSCLEALTFGRFFDQAVVGVRWPASLRRLTFSGRFNQPVVGATWSAFLVQLTFSQCFNQPVIGVALPASLRELTFDTFFDQPIVGVRWPASLQQLSFGNCFNQEIVGIEWPASLRRLTFGRYFDQPVAGVVWPESLQELTFGGKFSQSIDGIVWPCSLERLRMRNREVDLRKVLWCFHGFDYCTSVKASPSIASIQFS